MGVVDLYNSTDATSVVNMPYIGMRTATTTADDALNFNWSIIATVNISSSKNYVTRIRSANTSGSPTTGGVGSRGVGEFYAVRLF